MISISDNTLYYTLSTIAQAGAAAFGFLGAFVLFRLQAADSRMQDLASAIADDVTRMESRDTLKQLIAGRRYREAIQRLPVPSGAGSEIQANFGALRSELSSSDEVRIAFAKLIVPTFSLIGASVVAIALVDQLRQLCLAFPLVLGIAVLWFAYVLFLMVRVLRSCIQ